MSKILDTIYKKTVQRLKCAKVNSPQLDARLICMKGLGISHSDFISKSRILSVSEEVIEKIEGFTSERCAGMPVSRIFGEKEFWGLSFYINEYCLDPRPETETLIEAILKATPNKKTPLNIVDFGTGSGCILISLLHEFPNARGIGVDISPDALEVAHHNAQALDVINRVTFVCSDWGKALPQENQFDIIVSNPPYIESDVILTLDKEVSHFDPSLALDGGKKGLNTYEILIPQIKFFLKQGGKAFFEIGKGQEADILRLVEKTHATLRALHPDLAGIVRGVEISCGDK